ncbi:MAG: hypothetical protein UX38_C0002G0008 [Microgenomates group bacterium GW2011_GWC1_46_16]|uniref:Uncharacterized protein n=1 Tax=Candidatus Collierbacteria bacterium RIFOXYA2_FULL_46_10 TaxID=1817726 RepID=A0A1F5F6Q2_9BACT|nr:MAG: hypothetical protein UX32_C0001G0112 [Microgenomates group bacterium GW2011_GWF1_46_12]KKU26828.1 MAG: hypothetical protein UX38_C0002G0008 [Microgenomates group bacterium GW2011_GWC1_46_16]KKU28244.1 MAG: hypothetical protein UX40_C0001G0007 [Microgenomates group bacterium GW2011_GWF2_46_18]KKU42746.1 MAG: hypothetical protein UX59_C0041G0008 [Microgenomates group bacterium GW2011_GWA1_46_7]KKU45251.1 MAG: hypothetical protein UX63_C0009G0015 [Microgenomates group bacterium GW2011_GWB1
MGNKLISTFLFILLIIVSLSFAYYYGTQKPDQPLPSPTSTSESTPIPQTSSLPSLVPSPTSNIPSGWETYTNSEYGFAISYPSSYQLLTDRNNLYGYPNGIALIYGGGQSYDLIIEHWDSTSAYEQKYPNQANLTVKKIGNRYISFLNNNSDPKIDDIIATLKITIP